MSYSGREYLIVDRNPSIDTIKKKLMKMLAPLIFLASPLFYMRIILKHVLFVSFLYENISQNFEIKKIGDNVLLNQLELQRTSSLRICLHACFVVRVDSRKNIESFPNQKKQIEKELQFSFDYIVREPYNVQRKRSRILVGSGERNKNERERKSERGYFTRGLVHAGTGNGKLERKFHLSPLFPPVLEGKKRRKMKHEESKQCGGRKEKKKKRFAVIIVVVILSSSLLSLSSERIQSHPKSYAMPAVGYYLA